MRPWLVVLLVLAAPSCRGLHASPPAGDAPASLYLVENVCTKGVGIDTRSLVRLSLGKDSRLVKETILPLDQRFFGHFGGHRLMPGGRSLATSYGGVIDLVEKKVVHDEQDGHLLGFDGRLVVYHMENANREPGIFAFDTATRALRKFDKPGRWDLPGAIAPDMTKGVHQGSDGILRLYRADGTTKDLASEFRINHSDLSSSLSQTVPCLWLDDRRFLTQRANGRLVVVDIEGKAEGLLEIPDAPEVVTPPVLWRDPRGRIVYACGGKTDIIDLKARTAVPLEWYALGHGFEASAEATWGGLTEVRHEGKSIGRWKFHPHEAETAPGLIAFPFALIGANLGSPDGVVLWSQGSGWRSIKMWPNVLVGWTERSVAATP